MKKALSSLWFRSVMLAAAIGVIAASPGITFGATLYTEEKQVTFSSDQESSPRLGADASSEIVVYTSQTLGYDGNYWGSIYYQRWDDAAKVWGAPVLISSGLTDDKFNDISGNKIVYTAFASPTTTLGRLMVYDIASGTTTPVLPDAGTFREARIDGDAVVWTQGQNAASSVMYRDLTWVSGVTVTLGGPTPAASNVEIGSRYVVWEKTIGTQKDIAAYDRLTGAWISVDADASLDERLPSTSGNWVAWQAEDASGSKAIRLANLAYKPVTSFAAVNDGSNVSRPSIDGDLVSYESDAAGNLDIYLYRISDGMTFQVTNQADDQFLSNLRGDKVAYVDMRGPSFDIYVTQFAFDCDADGDGYVRSGCAFTGIAIDCDDTNPAVNPAALEVCDYVDNNCDGVIDEGCSCITNLAARAKSGKVQLTWTNMVSALSTNIYRGTISGGPYLFMGNTTSTYATWLDSNVINGTTYYYVVRPVIDGGAEWCQSNESSAKPVSLR
jgi:hypothetical protein